MTSDEQPLNARPRDERLGLGLVGGGATTVLLGFAAGSSALRVAGTLASLGGVALIARSRLDEREQKIEGAEERISSELAGLDPLARARVLQDLAELERPDSA